MVALKDFWKFSWHCNQNIYHKLEDNNAVTYSDVAYIIKYNRQKREGQGISQNFKAKNATFMDLIVINRLNNDKI